MLNGCSVYYNAFYADPDKCFAKASNNKPYDVIIVPGFPADSAGINGVLTERLSWAAYLYKNGFTKNIIFSGAAVYTPYVEAEALRLYALQLGIPSQHIFTETKAKHTTENLYYSCMMAKELGFIKIAFATQPAQASFMKPFRRKFKLKIDMLPVVTDTIRKNVIKLNYTDIKEAFVPQFVSIEKKEGIIKRFLGTRGHKVKVEMRKARRLKRKQKVK